MTVDAIVNHRHDVAYSLDAKFSPFYYLVIIGEKKLGTVITPDTWKDGARNTTGIFFF
jgi:hypothetical protein